MSQGVKEIPDEDERDMVALKFNEKAELAKLGVKRSYGEESYNTLERRCGSVCVFVQFCAASVGML